MKPMVHSMAEWNTIRPSVHGEQPVEDLNPGRDRDNHGGNTEEGVYVGARTHSEEVVQPDDERQNGNTYGCPHQRGVTKQTFTREGCRDFGEHTEHRQNRGCTLPGDPEAQIRLMYIIMLPPISFVKKWVPR